MFSFIGDLIFAFGAHDPISKMVALYAVCGGVVGGLVAAIPGLIDLLSLPPGPRGTAIVDMSINRVIVALFVINAWLEFARTTPAPARR